MVDAVVDGQTRRFILDTGAARTQLVSVEGLKRKSAGVERGSGGVFASADHDLSVVPKLRVGPIAVGPLTVTVVPGAKHARNLLGMDVLGRFRWRLSLQEASLTVEPEAQDVLAHDLCIGSRGHPFLELAWDGAVANACWDTGAGITIVDAAFVERHALPLIEEAASRGMDSTGAVHEIPTFVMHGLTIGAHHFRPHRVAVVDLSALNATAERPTDLILGFTTLSQVDWLMDFPSRRWSAAPLRGPSV